MLSANDVLGYPFDLTNFPVSQNFDPTNIEQVKGAVEDWEENLIESKEFKNYVLAILREIITLECLEFVKCEYLEVDKIQYGILVQVIPNSFFESSNFSLVIQEDKDYSTLLKIHFDSPANVTLSAGKLVANIEEYEVQCKGMVSQQYQISSTFKLSEIVYQTSFEWDWS
jgi:hypothetical protein